VVEDIEREDWVEVVERGVLGMVRYPCESVDICREVDRRLLMRIWYS